MPIAAWAQPAPPSTEAQARSAYRLAVEAYDAGRYYETQGRLEEVVALLDDSNARVELLRARAYYRTDRLEEARQAAARTAQMEMSDALARELEALRLQIESARKAGSREAVAALGKELRMAAQKGDTEQMEALLARGAPLEARSESGWTPLHRAARYSESTAVVQILLDAGADVHAREEDAWAPLHLAARYGTADMVEALLAAGAEVHARNANEWAPLHLAARHGKARMVKALLAAGASVQERMGEKAWTPLHIAAQYGGVNVVEALLAAGATVNDTAAGDHRVTPLHAAVMGGKIEIVRLLLAAGAELNAPMIVDGMPCTPLNMAKIMGKDEVAALLRARGATE